MSCFPWFRRKETSTSISQTTIIDEEVSHIQNTKLYTYKEIQLATEDFSPINKVGQGGFGSVFKGTLNDGSVVAVKVLSANSMQGVREFLTEIDVIAEIEHENLVKLLGCCVEGNNRILVYGYLENNSLAQTLVGGKPSSLQFSWPTRRKICIGVAKGLAFLHEDIQPYIVHRDIKASNILLDKNLNPKISDFGLAKLIPANLTHVSTRVAGTAGYLAPEYALRGQLNRKADIYSFGVLLLEIVSGRSNTNRRLPIAEQYLLEKAWQMHERGELVQLVDTSLNGDFNLEEACKYIKIALLCTQDKPKLRPSMSTVVKMLVGEIIVNDQDIAKPGLLSEFMSIQIKSGQKNPFSSGSADLGNHSSSSSGHIMDTSHGTMTFNSMYDRTQ
jgi:serine/threonine protein kinase